MNYTIDANVIGQLDPQLVEELELLRRQATQPSGRYYPLTLIDETQPAGQRTSCLTFVLEDDHMVQMDMPGVYSFVATGTDPSTKMMVALETTQPIRNGIAVRPIG